MRGVKKQIFLICLASFLCNFSESSLSFGLPAGKDLNILQLKCESKVNPLGLDAGSPRLSWNLSSAKKDQKQNAYQILVASDKKILSKNKGDLWNSGKIISGSSIGIRYSGKPLQSSKIYYWKVRVWDKNGKVSGWSEPSSWEMGLLETKEWQGQWISDGKGLPSSDEDFYADDPAPLFRKSFPVKSNIIRARLYISGLGYYISYLNGRRIGDHELDPGWTDYADRIYYSAYDVTDLIKDGDNCLGVMLGNGWYNPLPLKMWGGRNIREDLVIGRPGFICQLFIEKSDGTEQIIVSDETWKVLEGPIIRNNIYLGEVYDARLEVKKWNEPGLGDSDWNPASVIPVSLGALVAQPQPPIKITAVVKPVRITEPVPGKYIFDMGQNFSGWAHLHIRALKNTKVVLRYGELLNIDGTLNPLTSVCG